MSGPSDLKGSLSLALYCRGETAPSNKRCARLACVNRSNPGLPCIKLLEFFAAVRTRTDAKPGRKGEASAAYLINNINKPPAGTGTNDTERGGVDASQKRESGNRALLPWVAPIVRVEFTFNLRRNGGWGIGGQRCTRNASTYTHTRARARARLCTRENI